MLHVSVEPFPAVCIAAPNISRAALAQALRELSLEAGDTQRTVTANAIQHQQLPIGVFRRHLVRLSFEVRRHHCRDIARRGGAGGGLVARAALSA